MLVSDPQSDNYTSASLAHRDHVTDHVTDYVTFWLCLFGESETGKLVESWNYFDQSESLARIMLEVKKSG